MRGRKCIQKCSEQKKNRETGLATKIVMQEKSFGLLRRVNTMTTSRSYSKLLVSTSSAKLSRFIQFIKNEVEVELKLRVLSKVSSTPHFITYTTYLASFAPSLEKDLLLSSGLHNIPD